MKASILQLLLEITTKLRSQDLLPNLWQNAYFWEKIRALHFPSKDIVISYICIIMKKWGDTPLFCIAYIWHSFQFSILDIPKTRVAEVGSLLVRAKMVIKTFIKQVFTIFASNVCFFVRKCKLANLIQCNMRYIQCNSALLAKEALFLTKKGTCFVQSTGSPPHQKWTAS